jgi:hypothetical protein
MPPVRDRWPAARSASLPGPLTIQITHQNEKTQHQLIHRRIDDE